MLAAMFWILNKCESNTSFFGSFVCSTWLGRLGFAHSASDNKNAIDSSANGTGLRIVCKKAAITDKETRFKLCWLSTWSNYSGRKKRSEKRGLVL